MRGSGTNSHTNQGSGSNVGVHQDATEHIDFGVNTTDKSIWFDTSTPRSGTDQVLIDKTDRDLKLTTGSNTTGLYADLTTWSGSTNQSHYTSRPTNTSVLYCIKYEPTYFMKNTYSADSVYSTDEMIIGRWIDGKPLYRKVIQGNITSKDQSLFVVNENVKTMISIYGYDSPDGIYYFPFNYTQNGSTQRAIFYKKDTDTIEFRSNSYNSGEVFVVILEYTKTTD